MAKHYFLYFVQLCIILLLFSCSEKNHPLYHIGILAGIGPKQGPVIDGFIDGMTELGYIEDKNVKYDIRDPGFDIKAYQNILEEFIMKDIDLIFVYPTEAALSAREMTRGLNTPVVFSITFSEAGDLINTLAAPGENITGVRYPGVEITRKRYEIFKELVPEMKNLVIPYNIEDPLIDKQLIMLRESVIMDRVNLIEFPSDSVEDFIGRLNTIVDRGIPTIDAILLPVGAFGTNIEVHSFLSRLSDLYGIPYGGNVSARGFDIHSEDRFLFRVGINFYETGHQAASQADKIFKGMPPANLPVLSSDLYLSVNYAQAERMGIVIPESLLYRTDNIIIE